MYGITLDDSPDRPVGTPAVRRTKAIHWNWTTDATQQEMADALGVTKQTIRSYLNDGPTDAVKEQMDRVESEVRVVAVEELKSQLQAAGARAKTADKPVKVWTDEAGDLHVRDQRDPDTGELMGKVPVPNDMELGADSEARYYARAEVREILEQLIDLVGAAEPDEHTVSLTDVLLDEE